MKIVCTIVLLGLAVVLAGCGGAATVVPVDATTTPVSVATITKAAPLPSATATTEAEPTEFPTEVSYVEDTPTATRTVSVAEAPTATLVAQLQATIEASIVRPTATADASGYGGYGGIEGVTIFKLKQKAPEAETLWVVHSRGSRSFDEPEQKHFVAIYAYEKSAWVEKSKIELDYPDYVNEMGVEQVDVEPTHAWLMIEGGAGAHSGTWDLLSFDGTTLKNEVSGGNSSPDAGMMADLDGDGTLEAVLNASDNYVLCYACGVRLRQFIVMRWDGTKFKEMVVERLPADSPIEVRDSNNYALDLYDHGLIKDAATEIERSAKLAPEDTTVKWNEIIIKLHADARREHVDDTGYPILANVFYGDYGAALDILRPFKPEEIFTTTSALIVDTPVEASLEDFTKWMTDTTTLALQAEPNLAGAYYLRGWAQYLSDPTLPSAISDIEKAATLDPNDKLFKESVSYLKKK